jgi:hypothetical protein
LKEIVMEEAYRTIKVSEGKRQINIPMAKAVIRALAVNAARGQLRSQQAFTKLLTETEHARKALTDRTFDAALDYKLKWDEELERRKTLGITGPAPLPHPDDIHLNFRTSQVTFVGPLTKEGKVQWDRIHDLLEQADSELEAMTAQLRRPDQGPIDLPSNTKSLSSGKRGNSSWKGLASRASEGDDGANIDGGIRSFQSRRAVRAGATRSRTPANEKMKDLLVLDSNIVQIEDVGGSNPLCSTTTSARVTQGSRHPQSVDNLAR